MSGPNSSFSELAAITIANYSSELFDNVSNNLPLLYLLKQKGNVATVDVDGGTTILENLEYGDNASFKWYSGYEELSVTPSDVFTAASFDWKQCNCNAIFSGREIAINSGPSKQYDLIKSKTKNAERTMTNNLGASLYYAGTENDGKSVGGLQLLVADDPTTGTVGGINRAATAGAFYANQIADISVETSALGAISKTTIFAYMNLLYKRTSRNNDVPNVFVGGGTYHTYFEDALQANQRFMDAKEADVGFMYSMYKGAKVIYDPNCSATRMYALNTNFIKLKAHKSVNMAVGETRRPTNQDAIVIPINWMGNMTCSNPSLQGVLIA